LTTAEKFSLGHDRNVSTSPVVRKLYETYYGGDDAPPEGGLISSHWEQEHEFLKVRETGSGAIDLFTAPFWGCNWSGLRSRLFDQACSNIHLLSMPNRRRVRQIGRLAAAACAPMGLDPTNTVFRQVCLLETLSRHMPESLQNGSPQVLIIGDGIGVLSVLFKSLFPRSKVVLVDLGKTLMFQAHHVDRAFPNAVHSLVGDGSDLSEADFVYCPTENLESLRSLRFDVAANNCSMQEMNPFSIQRYFDFMRDQLEPGNLFICCNRKRKEMVGGEIAEFAKYPWQQDDRILIDERCKWQRFYFSRSRSPEGPRPLGLRLPLVNYYDGPIWLRLASMATN